MRTVSDAASVRLYHLDADSGGATTVMYGPLSAALREADLQPEEVKAGLFLQTDNDVVAYLDLIGE
jgi:hypothetical protein